MSDVGRGNPYVVPRVQTSFVERDRSGISRVPVVRPDCHAPGQAVVGPFGACNSFDRLITPVVSPSFAPMSSSASVTPSDSGIPPIQSMADALQFGLPLSHPH